MTAFLMGFEVKRLRLTVRRQLIAGCPRDEHAQDFQLQLQQKMDKKDACEMAVMTLISVSRFIL